MYGMPCEAAKRGASLILPIGKIADALTAIALEPQTVPLSEALDLVAELVLRESGIRVQPAQHPALRSAIVRALPNGDAAAFLRPCRQPGRRPPRDRNAHRRGDDQGDLLLPRPPAARHDRLASAARARTGRGLAGSPGLVRRLRDRRGGVHARAPRVRGVRPGSAARADPGHRHLERGPRGLEHGPVSRALAAHRRAEPA